MLVVKVYDNVGEPEAIDEIWNLIFKFETLKKNAVVITIPSEIKKTDSAGLFTNPRVVEIALVDELKVSNNIIIESSEVSDFADLLLQNGWLALCDSDISVYLAAGQKST